MQRKEVRIALGIVGCLLVIFAVALVWRLGFSGTPKTDEVAAAPDDKEVKGKEKAAATLADKEDHDTPTVLTATKSSSAAPKNAAAQAPAPAAAEADDKNWQRDYQHEPVEADPAEYAAEPPAATDPWANYKGADGGDFAKSDPYGYGGESDEHTQESEEPATPDQFAQHEAAAAPPDAEAQPVGKSRGNPIRQQSQTGSSRNPFRAAAPAPVADGDAQEADAMTAAHEPRPNLQDDPAADIAADAQPQGGATGANPLHNGWAISPAGQREGFEEDPVEPIDDTAQAGGDQPGFAAAAVDNASPAPQRSTPQLLGNNATGASIQPTGRRAAATDTVVPTSAETEAPESLAADGFYKVAAGDTYWRISRAIYGDPGYYRALYEHNRQRFPRADKLPPGTELATPSLATLEQMHPEFCPSKSGQ